MGDGDRIMKLIALVGIFVCLYTLILTACLVVLAEVGVL